jgi:hypothetical protein
VVLKGIKEPVLMHSHSCESFQKLANNFLTGDSLEIEPQKTGCWPIIRNRTKPRLDIRVDLSFDTCDFQKNQIKYLVLMYNHGDKKITYPILMYIHGSQLF